MTSPYHLHALAAAHSLADALAALEQRAREAANDAVNGDTSTRDIPLSSPAWGRRHALGGHGDPTANRALAAWAPGGPEPHAALLGDMLRHLDERYGKLPGAPGMDPLTRIRHAIPAMPSHVAADIAGDLQHMDEVARRKLQMPSAREPLPGPVPPACPGCRQRRLEVSTVGPVEERVVVCGGCGRIWPRAAVLAGAAPTTTT